MGNELDNCMCFRMKEPKLTYIDDKKPPTPENNSKIINDKSKMEGYDSSVSDIDSNNA